MGTAWVRFEYVAWFRDERLPPDDEDYEWPTVFVIQAPDQDHAKEWGDRLAAQRALDTSEILIRSWTSPCLSGSVDERLPLLQHGQRRRTMSSVGCDPFRYL